MSNRSDRRSQFREENAAAEESYSSLLDRTREISAARKGDSGPFSSLMSFCADYLLLLDGELDYPLPGTGVDSGPGLEELAARNAELFGPFRPQGYGRSFCNPTVTAGLFGADRGGLLAFLALEIARAREAAVRGQAFLLPRHHELLHDLDTLEAGDSGTGCPARADLEALVMSYAGRDRTGEFFWAQRESFDPDFPVWRNVLEGVASSTDEPHRLLYSHGCLITPSETRTASHLRRIPGGVVEKLALSVADAYFRGFEADGKDVSSKSTVSMGYYAGFERLAASLMRILEQRGLRVCPGAARSTPVNEQLTYDHRFDFSLYLDEEIGTRRIENLRAAHERTREVLAGCSGFLFLSRFGKEPFSPEEKAERVRADAARAELDRKLRYEAMTLGNRYLPRDETSFTVVAFPSPEIGPDFDEIFERTVEINSLPSEDWARTQKLIIDALDAASHVRITGSGENATDLSVALGNLADPATQSNFLNCLADQNVPLGEVFTSPVLKGTHGTLHVGRAFLMGLGFSDLRIEFEDGMTTSCTCSNFPGDEEKNREFVRENLLFPHDSLPMGEFAIGTNTLAYAMAHTFGILDRLPVLIIEKMGPHFAIGDTCFAREEDHPVHNPIDGKEVVARENEMTALRKESPEKAYTQTHIDITIPYRSIGRIAAVGPDGDSTDIIRDGRFCLPGTEHLNEPLDAMEVRKSPGSDEPDARGEEQ